MLPVLAARKQKKRQENKNKTSSQCVPSMRETREKNLYLRGFWTMVAASPCPQSGHRFREAKQKRKFRKSRRRRKRVSPKHEHESGKKKEEPSGQRTDNSSCLRELFNSNLFPREFSERSRAASRAAMEARCPRDVTTRRAQSSRSFLSHC